MFHNRKDFQNVFIITLGLTSFATIDILINGMRSKFISYNTCLNE